MWKQGVILRHVTEPPPFDRDVNAARRVEQGHAADLDPPALCRARSEQEREERRLSGAVRPDDGERAHRSLQIDVQLQAPDPGLDARSDPGHARSRSSGAIRAPAGSSAREASSTPSATATSTTESAWATRTSASSEA
jgi:hypothetical protein